MTSAPRDLARTRKAAAAKASGKQGALDFDKARESIRRKIEAIERQAAEEKTLAQQAQWQR